MPIYVLLSTLTDEGRKTVKERPERDNKTIARMSLELGSRGTIQIMSLAAIPIDEFIESLKKR